MGKINPRATQARNRKAVATRKAAEEAQRKAWWDANGKKLLIAAIAAVVILAAVIIGVNISRENALPKEIGSIAEIQDNWLVIDVDPKVGKRYHHPASFDIPQGYSKAEFTKYNDGVARDFYLQADDENAAVSTIYVDAAASLTASEYIQRLLDTNVGALSENTTTQAGEPFQATIAGKQAECLYMVYTVGTGEDAQAFGCLFTGFDAPSNVSVLATVNGAYATPDTVQSVEALLAEAETLLAGLTIVE